MDVFLFWFWLILLLVAIAAWPSWSYTRERWPYRNGGHYRYYPSVAAALIAFLILFLFWLGVLAIAWPWTAAPVAVE